MPKPTTDATLEVEYYKKLMEIAARKKNADLFKIMKGEKKLEGNATSLQKSAWDDYQLDLQELIISSVGTDMGQQLMELEDGSATWKYLCELWCSDSPSFRRLSLMRTD
ncbi:hypothetical protein PHYPSEUDO_007983 [Phytophthora pseudosyringae]|uniref:Uncharacterized protein n=1 Tax=Phytophthora pseudosyringae TaxID=221518 RepID=A0A8T1WE49_9STRA|nr:hypothetical protein PHYPSEUDO_007983 [Phytophthora pseudosyringae]